MSTDETALWADARLGQALEDARHTELYRYIMDRAKAEHVRAIEGLAAADPTDWRAIAGFQATARRYTDMIRWIDEAIEQGQAACAELDRLRGVED